MKVIEQSAAPAAVARLRRPGTPQDWWVLALAAAAYTPLLVTGYGADIDTYYVVHTGERLLTDGEYVASRNPGYPVHELGVGLLNRLGGSAATTAGSALMALLALWGFLRTGRHFRVPHLSLLAIGFALHPLMWSAATETMDYAWALGFGLAGGAMLLERRPVVAGGLFAFAIGARFTSVLFVLPLLAYAGFTSRGGQREVWLAAALALGGGALFYLPIMIQYGGTLEFLIPAGADEAADWRLTDRFGRFVYKNLYGWGLPGGLGLGVAAVWLAVRRPRLDAPQRALLWLAAAVVVLYQVLFVRFPFEVQYLLPTVPFVLLAAGVLLPRKALLTGAVLVLLFNAVSLNVARPDAPNHARGAEVGLWLEPGYLLEDVMMRLTVRDCQTVTCWVERSGNGAFPEVRAAGRSLLPGGRIGEVRATGAAE